MPEVHGKFVCSTSMSNQMCPGLDWEVFDKASTNNLQVCTSHVHLQNKSSSLLPFVEAVTCSSLTTAGTVAKQWDQAMTMVGVMRQQGVVLDGIAWSATVAACAAGLQWPGALQMAMQTVSASTPSDLSGAVASTVLGCAHWRVP